MEPPEDIETKIFRDFVDNFVEENKPKLRTLAETLLEFSPISEEAMNRENMIDRVYDELEGYIFPNFEFDPDPDSTTEGDIQGLADTIFNNILFGIKSDQYSRKETTSKLFTIHIIAKYNIIDEIQKLIMEEYNRLKEAYDKEVKELTKRRL
jgi:hypothetical protein